jgi:hypothetical protein
MNKAAVTWAIFRVLRWALWLATAAYYINFSIFRAEHLNSFGHLLPSTEAVMFLLPLAAVFMGHLEMMMRERAGVPRVYFCRIWPPPQGGPGTAPGVTALGR